MKFKLNTPVLLLIVSVFWGYTIGGYAAGFSINAEVDRTEVAFGESLQLVITIVQETGGMFGSSIGAPKLAQIPGFDIAGQSSSHNMTIVNGVGQVQVQTVLELVPQGPGKKEIPSLTVRGPDGKSYSTNPITVTILKPSESPTSEPEATEDVTSSEHGIGFRTGLFLVFLVIALVIAVPLVFSWFLNRNRKPNY